MRFIILLSIQLAILLVFSACGKTGDLYLPDAEPPTEKAATPAEK